MTGLAIIGAMLKRKIRIEKRLFQIWPAFQTLLVGPPGSKKSTAARHGLKLIRDHLDEKAHPYLLANAGTAEALVADLATRNHLPGGCTGIQVVSELSTALGNSKYLESMVHLLTELYDSPDLYVRKTKSSDEEKLENVAVSAVLCSNENNLMEGVPPIVVKGGLASRIIIMYETYVPPREAYPEDHMPTREEEARLVKHLMRLLPKEGRVRETPEAKKWHRNWYANMKVSNDPDMTPFYNRIQGHAMRIAMLLAAVDEPTHTVTIQEQHHYWAVEILKYVEGRLPALYAYMDTSEMGRWYNRVKGLLRDNGGQMSLPELGKKVSRKLTSSQLGELLRTMQQNGEVETITVLGTRDNVVRLK